MRLGSLVGDRAFYRKLFAVMLPILVQNVITNFVNLLDNVMVGQVGTEPMSGVAIVNQLLFVYNVCIFGALAGAGILAAQYYGSGDNKGVADILRAKLYIAFLTVAAFMAVLMLFGEELILQFIHEGEEGLDLAATLDYGKRYLAIMLWQMPPFALMQVYASTLRETSETVLPMKAGIAAVLTNLVGNYLLIFGKFGFPELGVEGAAIATVISRYLEAAIVIIWSHRHGREKPFFAMLSDTWRIPGPLLKQVLILGMPLLLNEVLWSGGMTMLNQCYSLRGLEVMSAGNISTTVSNLFFCAFLAMGSATAIIVGQLLGAGELERAVDEDFKLIAFAVVLCVAVGAVLAVLAPFIPLLYNTTGTVRSLASQMLLVVAVCMPMFAFTNSCYFTLRSGGKTMITFVFDSLYLWVLCVPVAFVLSRYTGIAIMPMYIIVQSLEIIKCVIGFYMVRSRKWVKDLVSI